MDQDDNVESPLERDHFLSVVLPGGLEKPATVHGSKPVMDVLVTLCASYHLNPSDYTVEILSANRNSIGFKPNSLIGSLEAEKIVLKPKAMEEKIRRPYMPEASVRLLINYKKTHKTVVRVNPRVPLELLLPAISDKCELNMPTTVLLRDWQSSESLDLTMSLNDHGLREIYAKDTAAATPAEIIAPPPPQGLVEVTNQPKKEKKPKEKDNKGFLSLFRRRKKKTEMDVSASAPASPGPHGQREDGPNSLSARSSGTLPADLAKKRRAPQPPLGAFQSLPNNLSTVHLRGAENSAESTLRRTKRLAPPPPCANTHPEPSAEMDVTGTVSLHTLEEDEPALHNLSSSSPPLPLLSPSSSSSSSSSSPPPLPPPSASSSSSSSPPPAAPAPPPPIPPSASLPSSVHSLQKGHGSRPPTATTTTTLSAGKAPLPSRVTLAQILTSSLSNEALVRRLRHLSGGTLGTEPGESDGEWEDPVQRKGVTTFKVIPAKKQQTYEVEEVAPEASAQCRMSGDGRPAGEALVEVEVGDPKDNRQEDLGSPESLDADSEPCPSEAAVSDNSPPTPPSPENLDRPTPAVTDVKDDLGPAEGESGIPASPLPQTGLEIQQHSPIPPDPEVENKDDLDEASEHGLGVSVTCVPGSPPPVAHAENQDGPVSLVPEEEGGHEHVEDEDLPPVTTAESPPPALLAEGDVTRLDARTAFCTIEPESTSLPSPMDGEPPIAEPIQPGSEADEESVEDHGHQEEEEDEAHFPPPPPPVFFDEESEGDRPDEPTAAAKSSWPSSTSNPLKQIAAAPSRFAQAVALAVQRSRDQCRGRGPQSQQVSARVSPSAFHSSTVPDALPLTSQNGSSCLGRGLDGDEQRT